MKSLGICFALLTLVAAGCGGDDDLQSGGGSGQDGGPKDGNPPNCLFPSQIPLINIGGNALIADQETGTGEQVVFFQGDLDDENPATPPDRLLISFWQGFGVFATGFLTGTFPIANAETSVLTCGICLSVGADISATGVASQIYFASGGSAT